MLELKFYLSGVTAIPMGMEFFERVPSTVDVSVVLILTHVEC